MKKLIIATIFLIFTASFASAATNVSFEWNPNSETDLAGYRLYQATSSGNYTKGNFVLEIPCAGNDTMCAQGTIENIPDGTYYWVVTAFDQGGLESGWSNEVTAALDSAAPAPPQNLSIWQKIIAWLKNLFGKGLRIS